eukprot:scpid52630/ scgid32728/ 
MPKHFVVNGGKDILPKYEHCGVAVGTRSNGIRHSVADVDGFCHGVTARRPLTCVHNHCCLAGQWVCLRQHSVPSARSPVCRETGTNPQDDSERGWRDWTSTGLEQQTATCSVKASRVTPQLRLDCFHPHAVCVRVRNTRACVCVVVVVVVV